MIDFDDILGGGVYADEEPRDPEADGSLGLVVALAAERGEDLHTEEQAFRQSTAGLPFVIFFEEDDDGNEVFANAADFMLAMDRVNPPTEAEAIEWFNDRVSERLAAIGWQP